MSIMHTPQIFKILRNRGELIQPDVQKDTYYLAKEGCLYQVLESRIQESNKQWTWTEFIQGYWQMDYRKFFISLTLLTLITFGLIVFITYDYIGYTPEGMFASLSFIILKLLFFGIVVIAHLYLTYLVFIFLYQLLRKLLQIISTTMQRMLHTILKWTAVQLLLIR